MLVSPASSGLDDSELGGLVEPERVHRRVYVDPDVYELEMDRVFGRSWIYVGHDSQVPEPGDYYTTQVGRQPVVMTDDRGPGPSVDVDARKAGHVDQQRTLA